MQTAEVLRGAILEHKETIVETIRNYESDNKALKDVAEKSYFKHLVDCVVKEIAEDQTLMDNILEMVRDKMINNDNEQFRIRIVKLVKAEITNLFKEDLSALMGNKKVTLSDYMPEEKEESKQESE